MFPIRIREGFKDQLLCVIPNKVLERFAQNPLINPLMPTAMGWYPNARYHYCEREEGAPEHICALCIAGEGWFQVGDIRDTLFPNEAMLLLATSLSRLRRVRPALDTSLGAFRWQHRRLLHATVAGRDLALAVDPETTRQLCQLFTESYTAFASGFVLERMIYACETLHHLMALLFFDNRAFSPALRTAFAAWIQRQLICRRTFTGR
jgi:hypothetical protein